jgi:hypothetical protein
MCVNIEIFTQHLVIKNKFVVILRVYMNPGIYQEMNLPFLLQEIYEVDKPII